MTDWIRQAYDDIERYEGDGGCLRPSEFEEIIRRHAPQLRWAPIETFWRSTPAINESDVLLLLNFGDGDVVQQVANYCGDPGEVFCWHRNGEPAYRRDVATHWMHLPEPPNATSQRGE